MSSALQRVCDMNTAFRNPAGKPDNIDWNRIRAQSLNINDEFIELMAALGATEASLAALRKVTIKFNNDATPVVNKVRDALMDVVVFAAGGTHLMGYSPDADLHATVSGVMTRFIKTPEDLQATIKMHADKGVTDVYFEGEYPTMVMKSASDQPDAPKGKFLKSASYQETNFPPPPGN
jgi:hypothetical protein